MPERPSGESAGPSDAAVWRLCERLFEQAVEFPEDERAEFLDEACGDEPEVRRLVEALLRADSETLGILDRPDLDRGGPGEIYETGSDGAAPRGGVTPASRSPAAGSALREPGDPRFGPGDLVAERFEVRSFLAAGGMGEVYEAFDREVQEPVAIKVLFRRMMHQERQIARFRREVQLARRITHPNACRTFDLFRHHVAENESPLHVVSMELLRGGTLADRLKSRGRLEPDEARQILAQLADGLAAVHAAGVVHRDLKTNNVVLVPTPAGERLVITDFGIARSAYDASVSGDTPMEPTRLTSSHLILGTPAYLAPEQILGHPVSPATDIYAMGVVIYEMLTGELPFEGTTPMETAYDRLRRPAIPPSQKLPGLDPRWDRMIERALAQDPADRYQSPVEALVELEMGSDAPSDVARNVGTGAAGAAQSVLQPAAVPDAGLTGETTEALGPGLFQPAASRSRASSRVNRSALLPTLLPVLLIALLVGIGWWLTSVSETPQDATNDSSVRPAAPGHADRVAAPLRVAMLGFDRLSPEGATPFGPMLRDLLGRDLDLGDDIQLVPPDLVAQTLTGRGQDSVARLGADDRDALLELLAADVLVAGSVAVVGDPPKVRLDVEVHAGEETAPVTPLVETADESDLFELVGRTASRLREGLGRPALGLEESHRARNLRPDSTEVARLHAAAVERLHHYDPQAAIERLERALELDPDAPRLHSTLADAWSEMGFARLAVQSAQAALRLAGDLPREARLQLEAKAFELEHRWDEACQIRVTLATFYEQDLEAGLRLVNCLTEASRADEAHQALRDLRERLPARSADDLRLDLADAEVAEAEGDAKHQLAAARRAAGKARRLGERLAEAEALLAAASAEYLQGHADEVLKILDEVEPIFAAAGHQVRLGQVFNQRGNVAGDRGEDEKVVAAHFARARAAYEAAGYRRGVGIVDINQGISALASGDLAEAERKLQQAYQSFEAVDDLNLLTRTVATQGYLAWRRGDFSGSRGLHEKALALSRRTGDRLEQAMALQNLGSLDESEGVLESATKLYGEAAGLYKDLGIEAEWNSINANLGGLELQLGRPTAAVELYTRSLEHSRKEQLHDNLSWQARMLAEISLLQGMPTQAGELIDESLTAAHALDALHLISDARRMRAELLLAAGDTDAARRLAESVHEALQGSDFLVETARSRVTLAKIELAEGAPAASLAWSQRALEALDDEHETPLRVQCLALQAAALVTLGRLDAAERVEGEARRLAEALGRPLVGWTVARDLALVEVASGRKERALSDLRRVARVTRERGLHLLALESEITAADIELRSGDESARSRLTAACQEAESRGVAGFSVGVCAR